VTIDTDHFDRFFVQASRALRDLDIDVVAALALELQAVREREGRVFVLGNGGSAANASHFVNDLRKVLAIEAYAPTDAVSELTARANDYGYHTVFRAYLQVSRLGPRDLVIVLSGSGESENLTEAVSYAVNNGARTAAVLGKRGSTVGACVDVPLVVPTTEHWMEISETLQQLVWHAIVTHPQMKKKNG
jgi:D-sedoheptulose 7-phosphate isomerase